MRKHLITTFFLLFCASTGNAKTFNFNSYYPAPYGTYEQIKLVPRDLISSQDLGDPCDQIGTLYIHEDTGQTRYCKDNGSGTGIWGLITGTWLQTQDGSGQKMLFPADTQNHNGTNNATNYYRVGIGTSEPVARGLTIQGPDMLVDYADTTHSYHWLHFILADIDPKLVLVCEDETTGCAFIDFLQVDPLTGNWIDSWYIGRNASTDSWEHGSGFFAIAYRHAPFIGGQHSGSAATRVLTIRPNGNVGFGDYNGTYSGFPTTNLHILNDDGSTAIRLEETTAPAKVWELRSLEGAAGVDRFSIWGGYKGSETEQLAIDKDGQVGIGTSNPLSRVHINGGAAPSLRLEGDEPTLTLNNTGAGGTTYRFRANDGMLKIENDGEGSFMSSLTIKDNGQVGIGNFREVINAAGDFGYTDPPDAQLAIGSNGDLRLSDTSGPISFIDDDPGAMDFQIEATINTLGMIFDAGPYPDEWVSGQWHHRIFSIKTENGYLGFGQGHPNGLALSAVNYPLHFRSGAYLTTAGVKQDASSIEYKKDVYPLAIKESQDILDSLQPVSYYHIKDDTEQRLGFIAEDVPDLIAEKGKYGIAAIGVIAVLTKNIQLQKEEDDVLEKEIKQLNADIERLNNKINPL